MIEYGALRIDPLKNPAVLDTGTWNAKAAVQILHAEPGDYWAQLSAAAAAGRDLKPGRQVSPYAGSVIRRQGRTWLLLSLADRQRVFVSLGPSAPAVLGDPLHGTTLSDGTHAAFYPTDAGVIDRFCRLLAPSKGPRALGSTPRLGIGCRMSTSVWPGIWRAMGNKGFAANAIQNSLRELSLLEELRQGLPPRSNHQFSFGTVQEGHTGSTFEGLWTEGVLSGLAVAGHPRYGADADHIMVKRTPDGLERARNIIDAGRYYSFFTLDVSDLLDYDALRKGTAQSLSDAIADTPERRGIELFHGQGARVGGFLYSPSDEELKGLWGKYAHALDAAVDLGDHVSALKDGVRFDLELSVDENPPGIQTCDNLTTDTELVFLLMEAQRRGLALTHVAPNFGIEKGTDYRCPDGLQGLEQRAGRLYRIAEEFGVMLDCHSGDDLGRDTRRAMGRASRGKIHFKISPSLQVLFGEVLFDMAPERFGRWWDDALNHARDQAADGSELAVACLRESESGNTMPHPHSGIFHHFGFATVGRRDEKNNFFSREQFYDLPKEILDEYTSRLIVMLEETAADVFTPD